MAYAPLQKVELQPVEANLAKMNTHYDVLTGVQQRDLLMIHKTAVNLSERGCEECADFLKQLSATRVRKANRKYTDVSLCRFLLKQKPRFVG